MSLRIPTFPEILNVARSRGRDSDAPHLWNGLVGGWPMQEGGGDKAYDASGHGNHGTLTNMDPATDWMVTERGRALDFDGVNNQIVVADADVLSFPTGGMSILVWVVRDKADWDEGLVGRYDANEHEYCFAFFNGGVDRLYWLAYDCSIRKYTGRYVENLGITDGKPHCLVATYDGGTLTSSCQIWADGVQRDDNNFSSGGFVGMENKGGPLRIGYCPGWSSNKFDGRIGPVALYSRALLPFEIQQLYADPWAMYRLRSKVFPAAAVGGVAPTSILYGSLVGPFGGPI